MVTFSVAGRFLFPRVHYTDIARAVAHVRSIQWFGRLSAFETSLTPVFLILSFQVIFL